MMHESLPQWLRVLRARKGWTLRKAAKEAEIGRDTLSDLERGRQRPNMSTLARLGKAYGVPTEELSELLFEEVQEPTVQESTEVVEAGKEEAPQGSGQPRVVTGSAHLKGTGRLEATGVVVQKIMHAVDEYKAQKISREELEGRVRELVAA